MNLESNCPNRSKRLSLTSSKYISYLLRHDRRVGELIDERAFISIDDLNNIICSDKKSCVTEQDLIKIVDDPTTKKRFEFEYRPRNKSNTENISVDKQVFYIRALNGHSFVQKCHIFEPWNIPNESSSQVYVYHVTNKNFIPQIMKEGLKPMSRQFVHLYEKPEHVFYDGKRNTLLQIGPVNNLQMKLFLSKNGYILCPHTIPPEFIQLAS